MSIRSGLEASLAGAMRWAIGGSAIGAAGLLIPVLGSGNLTVALLIHLGLLVGFGLVVSCRIFRYVELDWFQGLSQFRSRLSAGVSQVALVTGAVALVTLSSSAALRYEPSLQFLQLLSALDIAWAATATMIGWSWIRGRGAGIAAGLIVGGLCTWSIWRYLNVVGFTATGGWLVDGAALWQYVLPYDMAAAVVAIGSLWAGASRHPTVQRNPQS